MAQIVQLDMCQRLIMIAVSEFGDYPEELTLPLWNSIEIKRALYFKHMYWKRIFLDYLQIEFVSDLTGDEH